MQLRRLADERTRLVEGQVLRQDFKRFGNEGFRRQVNARQQPLAVISEPLSRDLDALRANATGEGLTPPLKPCGSGGTNRRLAWEEIPGLTSRMSAAEIIEQFKSLPPAERAEVAKFIVENDDSWVPEEFKEAMEDLEAGRVFDMETVMSGAKPPPRPAK